jgi:hypothetical protein
VRLATTGHVGDTAFRPLGGVRIEVVDGPQAGASMTSSDSGEFPLVGDFERTNVFRATKDGYAGVVQAFSSSYPGGPPWLVVFLAPLAPPVNIAGDYTLTFVADSACADLPVDARRRSYAATITPGSSSTSYVLTATGSAFVNALSAFTIGVAGDTLGLAMHGGHDPVLAEQTGPNTYVAYSGVGSVTGVNSQAATLSAVLDGWVEYCVLPAPMGPTYNCGTSTITGQPIPGAAIAYANCESTNHRVLLTRR